MIIVDYFYKIFKQNNRYTSTKETTKQHNPAPHINCIKLEKEGINLNIESHNSLDHIEWILPCPSKIENNGKIAFINKSSVYKCFSISESKLESECLSFNIQLPNNKIPCISSYDVEHASTMHSKDGKIKVHTRNIPDQGICKFLWSTGVITTEPILRNVRPGTYVTTIISIDEQFTECNHNSPPACVEVRGEMMSSICS